MNMNAVGIDVSKGKSTVSRSRRPGGEVLMQPRDIPTHQVRRFSNSGKQANPRPGRRDNRTVMERTGQILRARLPAWHCSG